jgi:hypothetical protein
MKKYCNFAHTYKQRYKKMLDKTSFRQRVINLDRGESITISVEEVGYTTIRGYASDLGFAYNRRYSTHRNRAERTYTITRTA